MKKFHLLFLLVFCIFHRNVNAQYCVAPHVVVCSATDNINDFGVYGIGPILYNSSSGCTAGNGDAYTIYPAGSFTTTLQAGLAHTVIINTTTDNIISLWIDYDHNAVFDSYEWTQICTTSVANTTTYATITVPATALSGPTGLRVRSRLAGFQNGDVDACLSFGSGETEDYTIDILSGPPNDLFANAQLLTASTVCNSVIGTVENCTQDISFFTCNGFSQSYPEVWYKFVPDSSVVQIEATGIGAMLPILSLWENATTFINCGEAVQGGNQKATINATGMIPGNTYYIAVSDQSFNIDYGFDICVINKKSSVANVTIDLDITPAIVAGIYQGGSPDIIGSFNGFNPSAADDMYLLSGNEFRKTYTTFSQGDTISFKFRINHNWSTFEATSARTYVVNAGDTLKCVWDSTSFTVIDVTVKLPITFRVNMSNESVSGAGVFMVGNFNNYDSDSTAMSAIGNGIYEAIVDLDTSSFITYRFVNGLSIAGAETVPISCGLTNVGGFNERFLDIPETASTIASVCFNECNNCVGYSNITFRVDLSFQNVSTSGVHLAGSFNNWDYAGLPMVLTSPDIYEATVLLDTSTSIRYKFVNGNTVANVEIVPAACGIIQGSGGYKRFLNVQESNTVLPLMCYEACTDCGPVGINKGILKENSIFFTAFSNEILLQLVASSSIESISIYNLTGKLILSESINGTSNEATHKIDAARLIDGVYFVSLIGANFKQTKKLIITR